MPFFGLCFNQPRLFVIGESRGETLFQIFSGKFFQRVQAELIALGDEGGYFADSGLDMSEIVSIDLVGVEMNDRGDSRKIAFAKDRPGCKKDID